MVGIYRISWCGRRIHQKQCNEFQIACKFNATLLKAESLDALSLFHCKDTASPWGDGRQWRLHCISYTQSASWHCLGCGHWRKYLFTKIRRWKWCKGFQCYCCDARLFWLHFFQRIGRHVFRALALENNLFLLCGPVTHASPTNTGPGTGGCRPRLQVFYSTPTRLHYSRLERDVFVLGVVVHWWDSFWARS